MNISILNGDALKLMETMPSESFDLIIADPPYNLGKDYGNNDDNLKKQEYIDFSTRWLTEAYRLLKPSGTIYVFMGNRFIAHIYRILEDLVVGQHRMFV